MTIQTVGHAWERSLFYTERNLYKTGGMAGGAGQLHAILKVAGCDLAPLKAGKALRREHLEMAAGPNGGYYVKQPAGWSRGDFRVLPGEADAQVVWDAGLGPVNISPDLPTLWVSACELPSPGGLQLAGSCMVLLSADVLRAEGAMISRRVSWERSATDLCFQLEHNPDFAYLKRVEHLLVAFGTEAMVHVRRGERTVAASLMLSPGGGFEGDLAAAAPGGMPDALMAMAAILALDFTDVLEDRAEPSLYRALCAARCVLAEGYDVSLPEPERYKTWIGDGGEGRLFKVPFDPTATSADSGFWCIGDDFGGSGRYQLACDYVEKGPAAIEGLPRLAFGALTTVDRREIEAFQTIRDLIEGYAAGDADRPLSIAVFGAPGSGKSFGVTQIARNVMPGRVEKLEFNVSQFTGEADIAAAFHAVRDVVLGGKLPLVFFDEFDASRGDVPLGWVKNFLMPMQDGRFRDGSGEHPVGRCILVFAGGTSSSFGDFTAPMCSDKTDEVDHFKTIKGPDFVSRLRGTIDVLGPNPLGDDDHGYILRRALLLRSFCERKLTGRIDPDVLRAMLIVPRYKHGARSMEAILDMSDLSGGDFGPAGLPFVSQLAIHVDADAFMRLVLQDTHFSCYVEQLARAIHSDYLDKAGERGDLPVINRPWEELTEPQRDANRAQARSICDKLRMVGCGLDFGQTPYPTMPAFDAQERLFLAEWEHARWMKDKADHGWTYGPERDDERLIHDLMIPWEQLDQRGKQLDFDVIDNIIPLLAGIGMRVYRMY